NAFGGPGGNIRIVAGNFFATPDSVIQASSTQSIAGSIVIDSPDTDIAGSITALPESFLDASSLLPERCVARNREGQSSFIVAGRGGTPIDPDGYLPSVYATGLAEAAIKSAKIPNTWHEDTNMHTLTLAAFGCRQ
ncbi:MAG: hypothetical protein O6944_04260, partial [Gammaproteobacteria bacterium]|nr:hypothetical protein [Gammaproteobacteria bacterium]